jgi:hypothetical protein
MALSVGRSVLDRRHLRIDGRIESCSVESRSH